jgi:hypothetical protein
MTRVVAVAACLGAFAAVACGSPIHAPTPAAEASPTCPPLAARSPRPSGGFIPGQGQRPAVAGTVESYTGGVLMVTNPRTNQAVKVIVTASTQVSGKIVKGAQVTVTGSQNPDGSVTATRVTVRSALPPGCFRPRSSPSPAA